MSEQLHGMNPIAGLVCEALGVLEPDKKDLSKFKRWLAKNMYELAGSDMDKRDGIYADDGDAIYEYLQGLNGEVVRIPSKKMSDHLLSTKDEKVTLEYRVMGLMKKMGYMRDDNIRNRDDVVEKSRDAYDAELQDCRRKIRIIDGRIKASELIEVAWGGKEVYMPVWKY
ncbi:MAG: hypothetical protein ACYSUV_08815 [Planctomycetota bacterium]|jgi:hypothetical protein